MDPNLNNNVNLNRIVLPPVQPAPADNTAQKTKHQFSTKEKVIGGLSALAILGTAIYCIARHKKLNVDPYKTVVEKDGTLRRLLHDGHTVKMKTVENPKIGGWERTITVFDKDGKLISERKKTYSEKPDHTYFSVFTKSDFNAAGSPTKEGYRTIVKDNNGGRSYSDTIYKYDKNGNNDENLLEQVRVSKSNKKSPEGEIISEIKSTKTRNEFGSFDESVNSMSIDENGNKCIGTERTKYIEEKVKQVHYTNHWEHKKGGYTADDNFCVFDYNKGTLTQTYNKHRYKLDENGDEVLADIVEANSVDRLTETGRGAKDYISYHMKSLRKNREENTTYFSVSDFRRDENGIGHLTKHYEDINGVLIEGSKKQKSGPDVKPV